MELMNDMLQTLEDSDIRYVKRNSIVLDEFSIPYSKVSKITSVDNTDDISVNPVFDDIDNIANYGISSSTFLDFVPLVNGEVNIIPSQSPLDSSEDHSEEIRMTSYTKDRRRRRHNREINRKLRNAHVSVFLS
jgi:hypothetical protein